MMMMDAGYGNSDYDLTQIVQKYDRKAYVQTNDQFLSLTDQFRLGVRTVACCVFNIGVFLILVPLQVELDTHYILVRAFLLLQPRVAFVVVVSCTAI